MKQSVRATSEKVRRVELNEANLNALAAGWNKNDERAFE